ncbi:MULTISPECIES: LppX_LprAFG lipoprotein [Streptacidiphilus]|uniref:LppX_LprAFG lipoprotein n=2 Tax=Streptacidiphilus TaxID=228398 RepID=A0ABV6UU17_9ACTN|nr:LppX_LprAFG lipoprotein [Streptacidiphilus jeojiense]
MRNPRALAAAMAVIALPLSACSSGGSGSGNGSAGKETSNLPAATQLLSSGATAMTAVQSVRFSINASGQIAGLALRSATGQLTRAGNAQGSASVSEAGALVEINFVIVGSTAYIKGATGGYSKVPLQVATAVYDPEAILDPNKGVVKLLQTATGARTLDRETLDGQSVYHVKALLAQPVLATLVPGDSKSEEGDLWLTVSSSRLVKVAFPVETTSGGSGSVTASFSDFDAPATITAPSS